LGFAQGVLAPQQEEPAPDDVPWLITRLCPALKIFSITWLQAAHKGGFCCSPISSRSTVAPHFLQLYS
jgi:hypothetical protein